MGDRISIQFKNGTEKSVVLFSHWGGMDFYKDALEYTEELKEYVKTSGSISGPLARLEPYTVMVDFIRHITKDELRIESNLYLGKDENDGDNSDNGHFVIDLLEDDITELLRKATQSDEGEDHE